MDLLLTHNALYSILIYTYIHILIVPLTTLFNTFLTTLDQNEEEASSRDDEEGNDIILCDICFAFPYE